MQIIVIDDQEVDRYLVKRVIGKWDESVSVTEFESPTEALAVLSSTESLGALCPIEERPIVVLLDINMPELSGFQLLAKLQELRPDLASAGLLFVMMFTSSDNAHDQERARSFELVKDYIVKPLTVIHLEALKMLHLESTDEPADD